MGGAHIICVVGVMLSQCGRPLCRIDACDGVHLRLAGARRLGRRLHRRAPAEHDQVGHRHGELALCTAAQSIREMRTCELRMRRCAALRFLPCSRR